MRELTVVRDEMAEPSRLALEEFVRINPDWNGAYWDDVLDRLLEADALISITEPLWDELSPSMTPAQRPYILPVTFTLYYANRFMAPTAEAVKTWVERLCPTT